jgi:ubiquinone/menaquinone biosynthesis C-methylase UbiE
VKAAPVDRQLAKFSDVLLDHACITRDDRVLDVGCGCGITTLRAAQSAGRALGLDISHPLVDIAHERAGAAGVGNVEFVVADAQTHDFGEGDFTVILSQFGLMFFDDPVDAFSNLRRALTAGGEPTSPFLSGSLRAASPPPWARATTSMPLTN